MPSIKEHSVKPDAKRLFAEINDLYLSIGLLFAAGLMLAFSLGYLLGGRPR